MTPRILVTRPGARTDELARFLVARGFEPIAVPTVAIDRGSSAQGLDALLADLDGTDWLVVTSAHGAEALGERMAGNGHRLPSRVRVAAVGPSTAKALQAVGVRIDHMPREYLTRAIVDGMGDLLDRRVVLARADAATPDLRTALLARGARVREVVAYHTVEGPATSRDPLRAALQRPLAGIAFTSGSTVRGLMRLASPVDRDRARSLPAFCIGPVTATEARRAGFDVTAVASEHTALGLADAIADHLAGDGR